MREVAPRVGDATAGYALCGSVLSYVVAEHYLQVDWRIGVPVPIVWWVLGLIAGVLGGPLLLFALGRRAGPLVTLSWRRLAAVWTLPLLAGSAAWLLATVAVLRRFNADFSALPLHEPLGLLSRPDLSVPTALALLPLLAKLTVRVPATVVIVALTALTLLVPAVAVLVFLIAGVRLARLADRTVRGRDLAARASVALVGGCVFGVPQVPVVLAAVLAGLAALPLGLALTVRSGSRMMAAAGAAAVPALLSVVAVLAVADVLLVPRVSALSGSVQPVVAVVEPIVATAALLAGSLVPVALFHRLRPRAEGILR